MNAEFQFCKGHSSTPVTHTNGKNSEEADVAAIEDNQRSLSDTKPLIKLQSLDSLDDYELVDYLDTVSDVLQSQTDDLLPLESNHSHTNSMLYEVRLPSLCTYIYYYKYVCRLST